ncbi:hypothetical protein PtB15_1B630 [Puccinia triticina]|nr:hypothetical protein PtB15_1B630 [Puccinia triticina]
MELLAGEPNYLVTLRPEPGLSEALETNVKLNKLHGRVSVSIGDGRQQIREAVRTLWLDKLFEIPNAPPLLPDHFIINLPDSSIQFLDAFRDLYLPLSNSKGFLDAVKKKYKLALLHCYCFTRQVDDAENDICQRVSEVMRVKISPSTVARFELKFVRAVAPHKDMYRITFELPLVLLLFSSYSSDEMKGKQVSQNLSWIGLRREMMEEEPISVWSLRATALASICAKASAATLKEHAQQHTYTTFWAHRIAAALADSLLSVKVANTQMCKHPLPSSIFSTKMEWRKSRSPSLTQTSS